MAGWLKPPPKPVDITLDGERVVAQEGAPIAAALVAAGKLTLARSPKFHRPRGPSCMRGACDGCLARVDGVPNVMTCLTPARSGQVVLSQNTLGSRQIDLLRVTDWFFPDGMNHHELFAGVPGVQAAMQVFARRVAGLGRLPDAPGSVGVAKRARVPVLVVGAGIAGMAAAVAVAGRGKKVLVVDDGLLPGGGALGLSAAETPGLRDLRTRFERAMKSGQVELKSRAVAAGVFGRDVLVVAHEDGALVVEPDALILATGAHDGVAAFENNDLPGVMSARAACLLLSSGVLVGDNVVLVDDGKRGRGEVAFGAAFEARAAALGAKVTRVDKVVRAKGAGRVRAVVIQDGEKERSIRADALLVDVTRAPAYELCEQAGAKLAHRPEGYAPIATRGQIADGVWGIGEVMGGGLVLERTLSDGEAIAEAAL